MVVLSKFFLLLYIHINSQLHVQNVYAVVKIQVDLDYITNKYRKMLLQY